MLCHLMRCLGNASILLGSGALFIKIYFFWTLFKFHFGFGLEWNGQSRYFQPEYKFTRNSLMLLVIFFGKAKAFL